MLLVFALLLQKLVAPFGGFISHDLLVVCKPWFYFVRHNVVYLIVERGDNHQRALERRLAEKLGAVRSSEGTSLDAAD